MSFEEGSPVPGAADTGSVSERSAQRGTIATPRTPRQWSVDSEEPPADVTVLRYEHDLPFQFARRTGDAWTLEARPDPSTWISKNRESWKYVSDYCAEWGPLSEVLPETPEPPREDDHLTTGELIAAPLAHRCSGCGGTNTTYQSFSGGREYYCEDCEDVFPYAEGDAPRRVQMLADGRHEELRAEMGGNFHGPVPASQSVPAVPVSSTGGKETGEAAETATEALSPVPYAEHERIVLEEIDRRDEAEEWADKLAAALAPPHVVGGHSLKNHPWRNALEWAQENRGPLPDSETEPCPNGECNQGMCGGISDPAGPCGGCCGCLSGCLDAGLPLRASEARAIPEPTEGQNRG